MRLGLSYSSLPFCASFSRFCALLPQVRTSYSLFHKYPSIIYSPPHRSQSFTMSTRAAARRAAALLQSEQAANTLSSPPATPVAVHTDKGKDSRSSGKNANTTANDVETMPPSPVETVTTKPKRASRAKKPVESMKGDWDVLPHGLGKKGDLEDGFDEKAAIASTTPSTKPRRGKSSTQNSIKTAKSEANVQSPAESLKTFRKPKVTKSKTIDSGVKKENATPKPSRKRKLVDTIDNDADFETAETKPKRQRKKAADSTSKVKKELKPKKHPYGLTPGYSPFPDHAAPSKEDCETVYDLLSEMHGEVKAPDVIPPPSMEVTGCGEVPDLLDALLRTLLSAATTGNNSNMALQGLKDTFGLRTSGVGKGSINWEGVYEASLEEVIQSIMRGGLAKNKSNNIKKILNAVHDRNQARRDALLMEKKTGEFADVVGAKHETQEQKDAELARFEENMLSLDYLFELETNEVMEELLKLPGIGVKTSSCAILFCMKRPSFAVDTHVWRHCKWLGWVPEKASRDETFSHCEVCIPDELKYALHQLFIKHGKTCPRCRANTSPGSEEWNAAECPIEHLVKRTGKMKNKTSSPVKKATAKGKKLKKEDSDTDVQDEMEDAIEDDLEESVQDDESVSEESDGAVNEV